MHGRRGGRKGPAIGKWQAASGRRTSMATWHDVYSLILNRYDPQSIMTILKIKPYRYRQIMATRHMREVLEGQEDMEVRMARHWALVNYQNLLNRVMDLALHADNPKVA